MSSGRLTCPGVAGGDLDAVALMGQHCQMAGRDVLTLNGDAEGHECAGADAAGVKLHHQLTLVTGLAG